ncbi:UNVERIFIED_CONTAM: hypothetical protein HDU68_010786 [Siphonaria sp. JEL0065]|nr:hypothetical protein HDU68_010786 [Siphonaria sp. JEL0065]
MIKVGILTVSDRVSRGLVEDRSGPALAALVSAQGWLVSGEVVVEDSVLAIQRAVSAWADVAEPLQLVLTTGGTGFGVRDSTPEAVAAVLDKLAPGLTAAMLNASLAITPMAALSRPVCGVRKNTIVVTLPGSPKGATENLTALLKVLPHAIDLASGGLNAGEATHAAMNKQQQQPHSHSHSQSHGHSHVCHHRSDQVISNSQKVEAFGLSGDLNATVATRVRKSLYPLVPFYQALDCVMQHTPVLRPTVLKVSESLAGHVLAQDVKAADPVPGYRASIVDGYAIVCIGVATDGPGVYPVVQVQHAGSGIDGHSIVLKPGTIARVTTGAMVPEGADAVIMVEDTELVESSASGDESTVRIAVSARPNENIRPVGSDASIGEIILETGNLISAPGGEIGLLASVGVTEVCIILVSLM